MLICSFSAILKLRGRLPVPNVNRCVPVDVRPLCYRPLCGADAEAEIRLQCCEFTPQARREVKSQTANREYTACAFFFNFLPLLSVVFPLSMDTGSRIKRHTNQRGQGTLYRYISIFNCSHAFLEKQKTPSITASFSLGCASRRHTRVEIR